MRCGDLAAGRAPATRRSAPGRRRIVGQRPDPASTQCPPPHTRAAATVLVMAEQDAVHDVTHAAGAALCRQTKQQRGQPSRCQLTHAWLGINAPAQSLQPYASQQRKRHAAHHARLCRFPIPDSRFPIPDSRFPIPAMRARSTHPVTHARVIGCRHSVKECVRLSSLYFRSPPQLPQELHEHRTACRNRPGDGRPG
ncbi:hypothetical protein KOJCDNHJ_01563 [Xanthomonas citri pv. punicae]|nr:hypothetical protein KOJCDNHJ_01563 [Xanthomonas citri pv. punicae]